MSGQPNAADDQHQYWNRQATNVWADRHTQIDSMFAQVTALALTHAAPRPGEHVLDIGCGAGTTTLELASRVTRGGSVLGADLSRHSVARANQRISEAGVPNAQVILADAGSHAFTRNAFDLAFSRFGVMFFPDPVASLRHVRTAMRPGARLNFVVFRARQDNPFVTSPYAAVAHLLPPMTPPGPEEPGQFSWADPARVRRILDGAGFRDVSLTPHDPMMCLMHSGGAAEAAELTMQIGAVSRALADMPAPPVEAVRAALQAFFRHHETADGITLPAAIWIVQARA